MQENTKSVIVKMTARRCFRTEPIWQYDVGHVLTFEGFELPASFEVHFSRSPMGNAIPQIGTDGTCTVPNMYTQSAGVIYAWLYIADTDTGLTKYSIEIPVAKRAKPTNQQPTPVEQSAIDQAIAALNDGVYRSETAADAAESAQEAAEGYAESAGQSAITATNAASAAASAKTAAETAARNAATSATDAHTSREAADQSATNAGVSERAAASSASAAAGSATSAAASAGQASASATAASGSASTASTKASEAAQSATASAGSAASASEDAGTASTAATAAEASATAAAGSATAAAGSATSAGQSATAAAGSAQAAQDVLDSIPADYSELSDDVDSLKSALNDVSGHTVIHPTEMIEGEFVGLDGQTSSSASWALTPFIEFDFTDDLGLEITGSFNGIGGCCIYDVDKNPIIGVDGNNVADYGGTNIGALQTITVKPVVGARYIRISARMGAYSTLTDIGVGGYTIAGLVKRVNALEDADTEIEEQIITTNKRFDAVDVSLNSLKDTRLKPYVVEIKSRYCWPLNQEPSVFKSNDPRYTENGNANNAFFKITGNAGDNFVTVVSGGNATPSDISDYEKRWSAVISYDDGVHFEPCLAWYRDANTLGVWPVLKTSITSGELGAMWTDGLHLTRRGYIGFAQAVFNANPKYCAKKTYVAKYVAGDTVPFTEFGGAMYATTRRATNYREDGGFLFANAFDQYFKGNTGASETTGKRGISWEIERSYPTNGYVEIMLGGNGLLDPDIPAGYEIQVDLYVNGVLSGQYAKSTNILETLYFDYADANTLKIEVYQNKQAAGSGNGSGFNISCIYFWEGVRNADSLFPKGAVVGQMFDSWGVFHDGASGKEFSRLINEKAGVTVPFENHSLGSQTSAWGKAWFYENLQKYHPAIGIVDFGINDSNSIPYSLPETVLGPDGKSYNNRIDITEYASNMQTIADEASNNGIQLICTSCPLTANGNWYYALADNIG